MINLILLKYAFYVVNSTNFKKFVKSICVICIMDSTKRLRFTLCLSRRPQKFEKNCPKIFKYIISKIWKLFQIFQIFGINKTFIRSMGQIVLPFLPKSEGTWPPHALPVPTALRSIRAVLLQFYLLLRIIREFKR